METADGALSGAARAQPLAHGKFVGCFVALSALVVVEILSSGTINLLTHPLWLDECLTELIANDPSFTHAMQAIRAWRRSRRSWISRLLQNRPRAPSRFTSATWPVVSRGIIHRIC
jgi:hypothetical protein